jgi:hypothetical protein
MTYLFFVLISLLIDLRFVFLAAALVALVVWALRYREPLRISLALGAVLLTALAFHHEIGRWVASAPWSTPSNYEPRSAYRSDEEEYRAHDNSNRRRPTMSMTVRICLPRPEERLDLHDTWTADSGLSGTDWKPVGTTRQGQTILQWRYGTQLPSSTAAIGGVFKSWGYSGSHLRIRTYLSYGRKTCSDKETMPNSSV